MIKVDENVYVEMPRESGSEAEFFLQTTAGNSVACTAHIHNAVELLYVKEGGYSIILDNDEYEIGEGDLILFCSNSIHHMYAQSYPVNQYYVIKIPPTFFLEFSKREIGSEYIMRFALNSKDKKIIWRKIELEKSELLPILNMLIREYEEQRYASEIAIRLKAMELLLAILRESNPHTDLPSNQTVELIYDIMIYVRSNYSRELDEKELAKNIGMSYSYFSRSFKRVAGMTFRQYLNLTRINKAEQMLYKGKGSITDIAANCGFNSTSYFIKTYKSFTGKTPYQLLRQKKK